MFLFDMQIMVAVDLIAGVAPREACLGDNKPPRRQGRFEEMGYC